MEPAVHRPGVGFKFQIWSGHSNSIGFVLERIEHTGRVKIGQKKTLVQDFITVEYIEAIQFSNHFQ